MGKRTKETIDRLRSELGGERTAKLRLEEEVRRLNADLLRADMKSNSPEGRRGIIISSAYHPEEKPRKIVISIDGVNASGKSGLIKDLTGAFDAAGYTNYSTVKESKLAPNPYPALRDDAKRNRANRTYEEREKEVGLIVTAGRVGGGRAELLTRLNGEGITLLDRYIWSTFAHQLGAGATFDEIIGMTKASYIVPDESIILTCDPQVANQRSAARYRTEGRPADELDDLERRAKGFLTLVRYDCVPNMHHHDTTIITAHQLARTVINTVIAKYVDETTKTSMLEFIDRKYSESEDQDTNGNH